MIQGYLKGILKKFKGCFKRVSRQFQRIFKESSRVFKETVKCVSSKFDKKFQMCFKNFSTKFYLRNFVVAWISSQPPEQKEGLFDSVQIFPSVNS